MANAVERWFVCSWSLAINWAMRGTSARELNDEKNEHHTTLMREKKKKHGLKGGRQWQCSAVLRQSNEQLETRGSDWAADEITTASLYALGWADERSRDECVRVRHYKKETKGEKRATALFPSRVRWKERGDGVSWVSEWVDGWVDWVGSARLQLWRREERYTQDEKQHIRTATHWKKAFSFQLEPTRINNRSVAECDADTMTPSPPPSIICSNRNGLNNLVNRRSTLASITARHITPSDESVTKEKKRKEKKTNR